MRIGRYDVTGEIGRGGMGVVLRGRSPDGRDVAIKLLQHERRDAHARFQREGRLLAALGEAQGFVPCLEVGESPNGPFIVMPFVEGGTLRERMRKEMPIDEAVALAVSLATSVGRAHERGIVHRDLKPENVLFTQRGAGPGDWGKPLVTDLGLARHYDRAVLDGSQSYALSRAGESRGTAGYMAPEQLSDAREARPSADVFALGTILYELLTGTSALGGGSVLEQFGRTESGRIRPPSSVRPEIPAWLDRVVMRSLAFEPARRYQDGHALAKALATKGARSLKLPALALGALVVLAAGLAVALFVGRKPAATAARAEALLDAKSVDAALIEARAA
ncbi:MAG: serine/threonine-protein kinase, partial [Planctomycetota bacterium]